MGEIRLDNCCRLCLKEGFSLTNIFSHCSAAGDPLYRILNFIYDIKISENDGLPSQICFPCMWRMIEFDACKRNVRSAEAEIMKLLNQIRPLMNEVSNHGAVLVVEETGMDGASGVGTEGSIVHSEAADEDEINVTEWENPIETDMKGHIPEAVQNFEEDDLESSEVEADPVEEFQDDCYQLVFCQPLREESVEIEAGKLEEGNNERVSSEQLTKSDESTEFPTSTPENKVRIWDTNKWTSEKDLRDDVVQEQESVSAEEPKSFVNVSEQGPHFNTPVSKMKNRFTCDICKKSFQCKQSLGRHVRIHYDYRLFSCSVCGKTFKQDTVRYQHELGHSLLKDKMNVRKCKKGSKKKLFICRICGKNIGSRNGLIGHSNQHSNKYSCSYCGKSFGSNFNLKDHERVHTKERPFKCEKCSKSFKLKGNLTRHMASHSSDEPFSCKICEKKFKVESSRNRHELLHLKKH